MSGDIIIILKLFPLYKGLGNLMHKQQMLVLENPHEVKILVSVNETKGRSNFDKVAAVLQ